MTMLRPIDIRGRVLLLVLAVLLGTGAARAYDNPVNDLHGGTPAPGGNSGGPPGGDPNGDPNSDKHGEGEDGDPVDLFTGQFQTDVTDIEIPGRMPLRLKRSYRSGSTYQGMFGRGWNIEFNERILVLATNGNLVLRRNNTAKDEFVNLGNSEFGPPRGVYDRMVRNPDGTYTLTHKNGLARHYNPEGCLIQIRDRNANQLLFSYEPGGKLPINAVSEFSHYTNAILVARDYRLARIEVARASVPSGRFIQFTYDSGGRVTNATDFTGRSWRYDYDAAGRGTLIAVTTPPVPGYPQGLTRRYTYSSADGYRMSSLADAAGNTFLTNYYDATGRIAKQTWGDGTWTFGYPSATVRLTTNGNGFRVETTFDSNGNVLARKAFTAGLRPGDPAYYLTSFTYNTNHEQTKVVMPATNAITQTFDSVGNLLESRRKASDTANTPEDIVQTYSYQSRFNQIKTHTDALGRTRTFVYDYEVPESGTTNGNLVTILLPEVDGHVPTVRYTFNAYGQVETATDPKGAVTRFMYDSRTGYLTNKVVGFGTPLAATNAYTYDARGNVLSVTDPNGGTTTFEYDALDGLIQTAAPAPFGHRARRFYDANRNLIRTERDTGDPGHPVQSLLYAYDTQDRLKAITNDLGHVTRFEYDAIGNRTKTIDANGNATVFAYDERALLWKTTDALTNTTQRAYSRNGRVAQVTDARTNSSFYSYDRYERLVTNSFPDGTFEAFAYDKNGNIAVRRTRAGESLTNQYDALDRLTSTVFTGMATNAFSYDLASRLVSVHDTNGTLAFAYDALDRLIATTNAFGQSLACEYDRAGNRSKLAYSDGTTVTYRHDALQRTTQLVLNGSILLAEFAYDALDRRVRIEYGNGTRARYDYDWADRLTRLEHTAAGSGAVLRRFDATYDNEGNRLSTIAAGSPQPGRHDYAYDTLYRLTRSDPPPGFPIAAMQYAYDAVGNRLSTENGSPVTYRANALNQYIQVGGVALAYDSNGNLVSDGTAAYGYDAVNRLRTASRGAATATYRYDPLGRRIEKNVNGDILRFAHDGDEMVAEYDGNGTLLRKYVFGPWADEPLVMLAGSKTYYYHADVLGTVSAITDNTGAVVESYALGPFGQVANYVSSIGNRFLFTGKEYDPETGLHYVRARYYDPTLGRFLQTDPIRYLGGINLYAYVGNNPVNFVDLLGLDKGEPSWLDRLQTLLDLIGLADPTGISDLINAGIYLGRGQYADAGISALAILPYIGDLGKAGRLGGKALRYADDVADLSKGGKTVLGHYPDYVKVADDLGARRFNVPEKIWNSMSDAERWTANQKFLDRMINRGDDIVLATPIDKVKPGSYYERELKYLMDKGYQLSSDGRKLVKP